MNDLNDYEFALYDSLSTLLDNAGVWKDEYTSLLYRYCKLQSQYLILLKQNPKHYMLDKLGVQLSGLEEQLLLTPKAMQDYQKNKVLMQAKRQNIKR